MDNSLAIPACLSLDWSGMGILVKKVMNFKNIFLFSIGFVGFNKIAKVRKVNTSTSLLCENRQQSEEVMMSCCWF